MVPAKRRDLYRVPGHEDHPAHPAGDAGYVSLAVCRISLCPEKEIVNGFLPLPGGHRAGLCGTAVYQAGQLTGVRDIIGVNLRIARP